MHVDDIGAQSLARNLKAQQRSGRSLEKGVDLGKAAQPVIMLGRLPVHRDPMFGLIKQIGNFVRLQASDPEQVPVRKG